MPQLIIIGVVLVGGWYAWKTLKREMSRVDREVEAVRKRPSDTLEQDPKTGKYRLKDKG
jgi:3-mercaptopyruvate sulfurtransferase SseA